MTPGYAHATWETMVEAVARLEKPLPDTESRAVEGDNPLKEEQIRKAS